ncbi:UNC-like C-terminal-domain-containing protein [Fennellomyces sp. T-0311]|nr:UNC-like C-terminal-domain-containing protein [Fennellomyces sp. T-0311]
MADYALATRGARIIPKMTSPTYTPNNRHPWRSALAQAFGIHPGSYRPSPLIALLPETHVGQCWPMEGANGTLGILLSEPISIKSVTMEYPTKEVSSNTSSAPQEFEVWGLRQVKVPAFTGVQWPWWGDTDAEHLGTFRYDTRLERSVQTFNVNSSEGTFEGVIFRVLSNWGHRSYTCLYRARVHGVPSV